jgi:hypothetical protein
VSAAAFIGFGIGDGSRDYFFQVTLPARRAGERLEVDDTDESSLTFVEQRGQRVKWVKWENLFGLRFERVSFLAKFDERGEGGLAFCGFFAFTLTASQFDAVVLDGAFEEAVVIRARSGDDMILGSLGRKRLEQFLEFAFGIFECGDDR